MTPHVSQILDNTRTKLSQHQPLKDFIAEAHTAGCLLKVAVTGPNGLTGSDYVIGSQVRQAAWVWKT